MADNVIHEFKIIVKEDVIQWDLNGASIPDFYFWLGIVESMIIDQVTGQREVTQESPS